MAFPDIPAGKGIALFDLTTNLPDDGDVLDAFDERYAKGNTTTDSVSFHDGTDDLVIWRKPAAPGSVVPVAGANFTISNNNLYVRNGWLIGTIQWARSTGTLTHGDVILTLPLGARPEFEAYAVTHAEPTNSYIFTVNVEVSGNVIVNQPPAGRTSGKLRFAMPIPYDYT